MIKRRALIVDDSRSARQILGRMLDSFGLEVDAVESAELALTYLQTARPDVIFMDHLMSGMDGFAAVRVLKANPDTATIPVLMYTSQEGEVYLSQARALGAVGVLPKTLKHADVANALQQLHLTADASATAALPAAAPAATPPPGTARAAGNNHVGAPAATAHAAVSRATKAPAMEPPVADVAAQQLSQRIANELKAELITQSLQAQPPRRSLLGLFVSTGMALLVVLGGLIVVLYWQYQTQQQLTQMQRVQQQLLSALQAQRGTATAAASVSSSAASAATSSASKPAVVRSEVEQVEYGEVPLSGARLERMRNMVEALRAQAFKGTLRVEVFTGDFCLQGNANDGYHVADDSVAIKRCDLLGNPFADNLSVPQRQSVAFANYVAAINSNASQGVHIQMADGGRQLAVPYPAQSATLTAGEWNRAAARNHRVEFTAVAASGGNE